LSTEAPTQFPTRFEALDGWRGISILLVLATHLLPIGPSAWRLNEMAGPLGMAIFFTLSGFLITHFLLRRPAVGPFLVRRLCRIAPLSWLYCLIALAITGASAEIYARHLLFVANLPPIALQELTAHLWSICMEVQFYVGVALLVALLGRRGLYLLPIACLAVTALRIIDGVPISIITYHRLDEILAGSVLALIYHRSSTAPPWTRRVANPYVILALALVASHPAFPNANYARPYLAAALVGATMYWPTPTTRAVLGLRPLAYIAGISYALYIVHPLLAWTWLGTGSTTAIEYLKRPLLFAAIFAVAHVSTNYYEKPITDLGKRLTTRTRDVSQPKS
jgi:peptidoglycan/LPS O-acetylase OafA/YrhL